jgi:hypothetical protein
MKENLILRCYACLQFAVHNQEPEQSRLLLKELSDCHRHFALADRQQAVENWDASIRKAIDNQLLKSNLWEKLTSVSRICKFIFKISFNPLSIRIQ